MSARQKRPPTKRKKSPKKSKREQRLERELKKTKRALAQAKSKAKAKPKKSKPKRKKRIQLSPEVQENLRAMALSPSAAVREQARADVIEADFLPEPRKGILALAEERARRLRETPGKPKLSNLRHDARGFVVAEDENGETYRAYAVTNKALNRTSVFFAKEETLEGYQSPADFLDAYGRQTDDGDTVFGEETHDVVFAFGETEDEALPF